MAFVHLATLPVQTFDGFENFTLTFSAHCSRGVFATQSSTCLIVLLDSLIELHHRCFLRLCPANIYLFKVNNKNTWKRYSICLKWTIKTVNCYCSLWTYFAPFSSVSIVEFEQVTVSLVYMPLSFPKNIWQNWKLKKTHVFLSRVYNI